MPPVLRTADFCGVIICKRGLCRHAASVCLSRSYILSKRVIVSSDFFHRRVAKPFYFFHTKPYGDGDPP